MFNRGVERVMQILLVGVVGVVGLMVARLRSVDKGGACFEGQSS